MDELHKNDSGKSQTGGQENNIALTTADAKNICRQTSQKLRAIREDIREATMEKKEKYSPIEITIHMCMHTHTKCH